MGQLSLCYFNNVEDKLFKALQSAGIHTSPQYPILGRRLDFAIVSNTRLKHFVGRWMDYGRFI